METVAILDTSKEKNLETFSLVWLNIRNDGIQNDTSALDRLRISINNSKIFQDDQECEQYVRSLPVDDRVVLIVNDQLGEKFVSRVHDLRQLLSIYIYCVDEKADERWTIQFTKVSRHCLINH